MFILAFPVRQFSDDALELPDMDLDSRCKSDVDDLEDKSYHHGDLDKKGHNHSNTLKEADISWDITENLDDIQLPEMDLEDDMKSDLDTENFKGVADENSAEIDELFASISPEIKRKTQQLQDMDKEKGQSDMNSSFNQTFEGQNESPLIVFTP